MPGIYLHIPFCRQACSYCDFYFSTSLAQQDAVVAAMLREIELRAPYLKEKQLSSIYFGGGTPSLLRPQHLQQLMEALARHFSWDKGAEITLEANPDDITVRSLQAWQEAGMNRLSIGLQSFNNEELRWMNRAHTAEQSLSSVKLAQDHGFNNLTIDLIYGSKFQTLGIWEQTLQQAVSLQTQHISSYNLTIEDKTVLGNLYNKGKEPGVDDDLSSRQFLLMQQVLGHAGFIQYEISNFGKPGFFAVHNSNYWLGHHYLGLGPSAHSFNGHSRQWNVRNNSAYIKAIAEGQPFFEKEELSVNDRYNEYVLTRLRTIWGCDVKEMRGLFGETITAQFVAAVKAQANDFVEQDGVYILTNGARLRADGIASELFLT